MGKNGSYSSNDLGYTDPATGKVTDINGNEVAIGLDDDVKKSLQELIDGPKVREMPSERDQAAAAGFTTKPRPVTYEDSVPSGGKEDVAKTAGDTKSTAPKATETQK